MFYKGKVRESMMGFKSDEYPLMEKFEINENGMKQMIKTDFWANYYRHNNYFYDNNPTLFSKVRNKGAEKGIEKMVSDQNVGEDMEELRQQLMSKGDGILSRWGIRSSSLNDIIRFMVFLKFDLSVINQICNEISTKYSMDKKLAYSVFRETEDEFSTRDYYKEEVKTVEDIDLSSDLETQLEGTFLAFSQALQFLTEKEGLELLLTKKSFYFKLKIPYFKNILKFKEQISHEQRLHLWQSLLPPVNNIFLILRDSWQRN
jgi:hypothetical protein